MERKTLKTMASKAEAQELMKKLSSSATSGGNIGLEESLRQTLKEYAQSSNLAFSICLQMPL